MNLLIADDHPIIIESLRRIISSQFPAACIFSVEFSRHIIPAISRHNIQFLILDIQLLDGNALKVLDDIRERHIELPIMVFSSTQVKESFIRYNSGQVWGFVDKCIGNADLRKALFNFMSGNEVYHINSEFVLLSPASRTKPVPGKNIFDALSKNELLVMEMLGNGTSIKEIACITNKKANTISTYKRRIFQKLNIKRLIDLIDLQRQYGK